MTVLRNDEEWITKARVLRERVMAHLTRFLIEQHLHPLTSLPASLYSRKDLQFKDGT